MKMFTGHKKLIAGSANRLLLGYCQENFYVKICYIFYVYSTISRGTPDDVLWNPRIPGNSGWETLL
jgi:hypothetical protein